MRGKKATTEEWTAEMTCEDSYPLLFPFTLCSAKEMSWSLSSTPAMLAASRRCMSVVHCA